jgi:hypothetical protein
MIGLSARFRVVDRGGVMIQRLTLGTTPRRLVRGAATCAAVVCLTVTSGLTAPPEGPGSATAGVDLKPNHRQISATPSAVARVRETYGRVPLRFEANEGQTDPRVKFISRGPQQTLFLTSTDAILVLAKHGPADEGHSRGPDTLLASKRASAAAIRMRLVDANPAPTVSARDRVQGSVNYLVGDDPAKWRRGVPTYSKVHYEAVYPGIDLIYYGNQEQLEYDFVVGPGADPRRVRLAFDGVEQLDVDAGGDLVLHTAVGPVRQGRPVVYQGNGAARRHVQSRYVRHGEREVGFEIDTYDPHQPLIIDPVLSYSTYLGGTSFDGAAGIAVDAGGNAYVAGYTTSADFPTQVGALDDSLNGPAPDFSADVFITKLDSTGSVVLYSTFLGGSSSDVATAIAVDAAGSVYLTGYSFSADFPTTPGAFTTNVIYQGLRRSDFGTDTLSRN